MSANIIKSLAVAALLSTTLINGVIACDIDAAELDILVKDTSKGIGQKIQTLKQDIVDEYVIGKEKAEIERFLAIIEDAITNSKTLHSPVEKSVLEAALGEYDNLYTSPVLSPSSNTTDILARLTMKKAPHSIVDLFDAPGGPAPTILTAAEKAHRAFMLTLSSATSTDIYVPHYETGAPTTKIRGLNKADRAIIDSFDPSIHTETEIKRIQAAHEAALLDLEKTRALENEKAVAHLRSQLATAKSTLAPSSASGSSTSGMDVTTAQKMVTAAKFSSSEVKKGLGRNPITTEDWLNGALVFASKAVDEKTDLEIAISDLEEELAKAKVEILLLKK